MVRRAPGYATVLVGLGFGILGCGDKEVNPIHADGQLTYERELLERRIALEPVAEDVGNGSLDNKLTIGKVHFCDIYNGEPDCENEDGAIDFTWDRHIYVAVDGKGPFRRSYQIISDGEVIFTSKTYFGGSPFIDELNLESLRDQNNPGEYTLRITVNHLDKKATKDFPFEIFDESE